MVNGTCSVFKKGDCFWEWSAVKLTNIEQPENYFVSHSKKLYFVLITGKKTFRLVAAVKLSPGAQLRLVKLLSFTSNKAHVTSDICEVK